MRFTKSSLIEASGVGLLAVGSMPAVATAATEGSGIDVSSYSITMIGVRMHSSAASRDLEILISTQIFGGCMLGLVSWACLG